MGEDAHCSVYLGDFQANPLSFRALTAKALRSPTMLVFSSIVALSVLLIQALLFVPAAITQHQHAVRAMHATELTRLTEVFLSTDKNTFEVSAPLLSDKLVGLIVSDSDGQLLLDTGLTKKPELNTSTAQKTSAKIKSLRVELLTSTGPVSVLVFLDVSEQWLNSRSLAVFLVLASLSVALVAGICSALATIRYFLSPVETLSSALRESRESSEGRSPETIDVDANKDLKLIAEEFNALIEEQKKSSRQVKVKQQYLEFAAHHDPLTHLPNRLMFENALNATVEDAISRDVQFAVFLVDLDNFKFFNDQYGHLVGDKMVAEVGNRLRTMMRDVDVVARLDGDEFVVIQKDVQDPSSAEEVAKRIMSVATSPYEYRGFTLKAAVSVGISNFPTDVHVSQDEKMLGEEIVNNAAVALQEAKSNGKNQYQLFTEKMRSRLTARIRLEQDLKLALQDEQFEVFYQPKINIHTRQCTGAEALVRWRHPVNGFVSPEAFVPVAEETGIIIELGEWILQTACNRTYELQQKGYADLNVAVNISAVQFTDGNLLPMVARALEDSNLKAGSLELEITESAVMHDPEEVISSLHELSKFGMRLAIDDFGTGYSSLAYLKRFPVNTLKIDRAFITDISSDNDDVAIVEAVLGLGKHFNMKVVAEGVEDEEQLNFLKSQGCDIAQGYFISKPLNSEQYLAWLERWPYGVQTSDSQAESQPPDEDIQKTGT